MNYLNELLPKELIYHNSINNQFSLVCNNVAHNICIYNSNFNAVPKVLFHTSLTGKTNDFFLKIVNTTKLSSDLRYFISNKPIIIFSTKTGFENIEVSIQQDAYLRIGPESKTYFSNGNSRKYVVFKDNIPENVGKYPINTFIFTLPNKSISLPSTESNIKFEKLDIDINSMKDPKPSLRSVNKIYKEDYTVEKIKEENEQNLINIKNEEVKM